MVQAPDSPLLPSRFKRRFTKALIALVFATLVCGSVLAAQLSDRALERQRELQFEGETRQLTSLIQNRISAYNQVAYGLQGLFAASESVEQDEWEAYLREIDVPDHYAGVSSIRYIQRVSRDEVAEYPFVIYPASDKDTYYPTTYQTDFTSSTSTATSSRVVGFDVSSEEKRNAAITRAASTGAIIATPIVPAITGTGVPVFSLYAPLYRASSTLASPEDRAAAVMGFVNLGFGVKSLFDSIFSEPQFTGDIRVALYDAPSAAGISSSTFAYANDVGELAENAALQSDATITVADRTWTVAFAASNTYGFNQLNRHSGTATLVVCLLVSVLISWVLYSYARSREMAILLANRLTADLQTTNTSLAIERDRLNQTIDAIGDGVTAVDAEGNFTLVNRVSQKVLGLDGAHPGNVASWSQSYQVLEPDTLAPFPDAKMPLMKALHGESTDKVDMVFRSPAGQDMFMSVTGRPVRDAQGNVAGGVVVLRDMAREHEIDRAKSEFVSLASHQLRTPPTIINYYTDMLLSGDAGALTDTQKAFVEEIAGAGKRMVELVHALLNTTRVELGTLTIQPVTLDLVQSARNALKELQNDIATKHISVTVEAPANYPQIMADPGIVFLMFQNLLSNAVRYTRANGRVGVTFTLTDADFQVAVSDNGLGIPAAQQAMIFTKLYRADNARAFVAQGTGLGLYLVKSLLDHVGGSIRFESREGEGTTFFLTLPRAGMSAQQGRTQLA